MLATELTAYLESLRCTQGAAAGKPLQLMRWQREFLAAAFAPDVAEAGLTMARGGGKTTFLAAIASAYLVQPGVMQPNSEVTVVASTREQGRILFKHVVEFINDGVNPCKIRDTTNRMEVYNPIHKANLRVLNSNVGGLHGAAPVAVIADEIAQWPRTKSAAMLAALRTGLGKIPGSRLIAIGTRAASPMSLFERTLKEADYAAIHSAPKDADPFDPKTWALANPSLLYPDVFGPLLKAYRIESQRAKTNPEVLQGFRALRLNQGVSDTVESVLIEPDTWKRCETIQDYWGSLTITPNVYMLGVDMGATAAMSAIAAYDPTSGILDTVAMLPGIPSLEARERADGVPNLYTQMAGRMELFQSKLRTVPPEELLDIAFSRWGKPKAIIADRWRLGELQDSLDKLKVRLQIIPRGQGFKDGGEDVRLFRTACLEGRVKTSESLLMRAAVAEARVTSDAAGNDKLAKGSEGGRRNRGKDDAIAAAILAIANGERNRSKPVSSNMYLGKVG